MTTRNRYQLIVALLICLLSASCSISRDSHPRDRTTAFVHVNLIPMDRERVIPDQTVIVKDGLIVAIGPADATTLPRNTQSIEGEGQYLMPGLVDMHVHIFNAMDKGETDPLLLPLFLANGVTTVRNMPGSPEVLELRERIARGDLLGPRIYTTGPILDGDPPFWQGSVPIETAGEAEAAVAAQKAAGYDAVKVLANLSPEAYASVLKAAAAHGLPVYGHVPTRMDLRDALRQGQRSFEHVSHFMVHLLPDDSPVRARLVAYWNGDEPISLQVGRDLLGLSEPYGGMQPDEIRALARRIADAGVWVCPTLVGTRRIATGAEEFAALQQPAWMRYVGQDARASWALLADLLSAEPGEPAIQQQNYQTILGAIRIMHEEGVPLLLGTDAIVAGFSAHEELAILVEAGLKPFEALAAATRDAADFLGASEISGTIEVGKRADLLLVRENPLEDVGSASDLAGVMANGQWIPDHELDSMLEAVARTYREAESIVP